MLEFARDGLTTDEVIEKGKQILGKKLVMSGVEYILKTIKIEANFVNSGRTTVSHYLHYISFKFNKLNLKFFMNS